MRIILPAALLAGLATPALAADLTVGVEIPKMTVAEYHRPYVAIWIETPDEAAVKTLAVWYDTKNPKGEGATWLKDMRQWWRRTGRSLDKGAINAVSSPTKAPGKQQLVVPAARLADLKPGSYSLVVEAAREVGGREVVKIPFTWTGKTGKGGSAKGASELGAITLTLK
ncbi:DUF2271 domain-containing protein [Caulobacter sp. NIBR1757]|uniref:DUF2271 domain-containing protein n=1 Tax=Caulobacter sp. NIBR1757 TaxID=3016000 RepID=UPI0022F04760|nr:DUF2271 domain-containing protein [Caulobacter sp. NIBR1757]WGM38363.1 hypothetical protein AMEJIAPC_01266 [Caulobacter sp. NIBR1757]